MGIRGWSFSGALAALAVLRRPDVFHAAVAGAAVTDQRLYDTHWRERFLGHPSQHPDRYDACSLLLEAPKLTRPLLLIHGLADDNVSRRTRCACPARCWPPVARTRCRSCPVTIAVRQPLLIITDILLDIRPDQTAQRHSYGRAERCVS